MNTVTFSKNTLAILKNFSSLNSNLLVTPGNVIKTITPSKTGMAIGLRPDGEVIFMKINSTWGFC